MRGLFFVCFFFKTSKWLPNYLTKNMWSGGECCLGSRGRALPGRGCRGEWHKGSPNKNELAACKVAIQTSMLLCKSLAIIIILFQSILLQLSAMYVKYTCTCIYTHRGIHCSPWISFGEGALNLDFPPIKTSLHT